MAFGRRYPAEIGRDSARARNARAIPAISASSYRSPNTPSYRIAWEHRGHLRRNLVARRLRVRQLPQLLTAPSSYHDAGAVPRPSCLWTSVAPSVDVRRLRPDTKMPVPTTNARNVTGCGRRLWRRWQVPEGRGAPAVRSGFLLSTAQTNWPD